MGWGLSPRAKRQQGTCNRSSSFSTPEEIRFKGKGRAEIYAWVAARSASTATAARTAEGFCCGIWSRMTGLSRAQITRLIQQYRQGENSGTRMAATGGIALARRTRPTGRTAGGWTRPTKPSAARPRARSSSGNTSSTSSANTSGWRGSRWPRSIACGGAAPTASGGCISPRPCPRRCRSASGAGPTRKASPAFCE